MMSRPDLSPYLAYFVKLRSENQYPLVKLNFYPLSISKVNFSISCPAKSHLKRSIATSPKAQLKLNSNAEDLSTATSNEQKEKRKMLLVTEAHYLI
jgi:hypothetical protein